MSKVIRISTNTEKLLEKIKNNIKEYYKKETNIDLEIKDDLVIKSALKEYLEKTKNIE